jgi:uncharacterized protein (DUF1015 family)
MPEFLPFIGTRYNHSKVNLSNVIAPPYDVIGHEYRDILYERDPYNVVRLELNRDPDPYTSAANFFEEWKREGILRREERPAFYVYHQIFNVPDGGQVTRTGVIGRIKLSRYEEKQVIPHERTMPAPKRDRLQLMEHTKANFSPIFGLISDPSVIFDQTLEVATVHAPIADVDEYLQNGEVVRHILWRLEDAAAENRIERIVGHGPVIIADGHHRYETALQYHEQHPEIPGAAYMMMFLSNLESEGTVILPTHRVLHRAPKFNQFRLIEKLRERYEIVTFTTREEGIAALERDDNAITLIQFNEEPRWVLVRDNSMENRPIINSLPVSRLEDEILKSIVGLTQKDIDDRTNLLYPHSVKELDEITESQNTDAAFLLRAVKPHEVSQVVKAGSFMPQKSTFFYPKLLTGLVFHQFEGQV